MLQSVEQLNPMSCHICGAGPWKPRTDTYQNRGQIVTEATWICGRCNSKFNNGIISTEDIKNDQKKQ